MELQNDINMAAAVAAIPEQVQLMLTNLNERVAHGELERVNQLAINQQQGVALAQQAAAAQLVANQNTAAQQQLLAHINTLEQRLGAAGQPVPAQPRGVSLPRLVPLPCYEGSSAGLDPWLSTARQHMKFYKVITDADQMTFVSGHVKGAALEWLENTNPAPTSFDGFVFGLRSRFQPVTAETTAREKLYGLTQGNKSIEEYVSRFRQTILPIADMSESHKIHAFVHGLKPALQVHQKVNPQVSLNDAINQAVRVGAAMFVAGASSSSSTDSPMDLSAMGYDEHPSDAKSATASFAEMCAMMARGGSNNGSGSNGRGAQGASGGFRGPRRLPKWKDWSEAKVKEYLDANKCFACHKVGHRAADCSTRDDAADGSIKWSG